jgi:ketosteroid isomerase-like protein
MPNAGGVEMGRRFFLTVLLSLGVTMLVVRPVQAQSREESAIRALIDRTIQVNNSVDANVVKQEIADMGPGAGPFYPPFAASVSSPADLQPLVDRILAAVSARTFSATSPITVRAEKNQGWAAYTWHAEVTFKDGTRHGFDGRTTAAFVRDGRNWRYAHWHSSLVAPYPLSGKELDAEGQNILQIERDAWEAAKNKNLEAFNGYWADDASVFSEGQAYRLKGKADVMRDMEAWFKQVNLQSYQMLDPQVEMLGDTALLTYYFTESGQRDGRSFSTAGKISMVFVKQDGKWRALHEHISTNR